MEPLPIDALQVLPFQPEPIATWDDNTDLLHYLRSLHNTSGVILDSTGSQQTFNYSFYGRVLFESNRYSMLDTASDFFKKARQSLPPLDFEKIIKIGSELSGPSISMEDIIKYGLQSSKTTVLDFNNDGSFGLVAKYLIAWRGTVSAVLSDGIFFSLAHVLETASELECSLLLASELYYKQALQILRSFLELNIMQLFFCDNVKAFSDWKADQYRTPPLRGKKGVLQDLVVRKFLTEHLAQTASDLYGKLNGTIHGQESQFINRGIFEGQKPRLIFQQNRFNEWCDLFAQCVNVCIHIIHLSVKFWAEKASLLGVHCNVCHNTQDFIVSEYEFGNQLHYDFVCKVCGNQMTFDAKHIQIKTS